MGCAIFNGEKKEAMRLGRRLVLFPLPLQGHETPMLQLATELQSKGFSITVIHTRYKSPDPAKFPDLTFHFIDDGLPKNAVPSPGYYSLLPDLNRSCSEPFRVCLSHLLNADQEPVTCLIADPTWFFVGAVADSFKLPRMMFYTETKSNELLVELPPLKVKDLPIELYHDFLAAVVKEIKNSQGIICNTFKELETASLATVQQALPIPIFSIGPLHLLTHSLTSASSICAQDQAMISWLNKQAPKSVLYVSFGSLASINEAEFQEIAGGLANSMRPFLWVVRQGLIRSSEANDLLPEGYSEMVGGRGLIVKWAPQHQVLAHPAVGGFWTHCGWNSIIESISQGVPMICQPFFVDQTVNARHVSDNWRAGLQLERGVTREEITKAIRRLMLEDEGEVMRNRVAILKEKAKLCLVEGGSSYESFESLISYLLSF